MLALYRDRLYANVEELYDSNPADEEDPYSYGNESIYDSICYYQALVSTLLGGRVRGRVGEEGVDKLVFPAPSRSHN